jgi:hypothetical protein
LGNRSPPMLACARDHSSDTSFKGTRKQRILWRIRALRQPVVRSIGAAHRPAAPTIQQRQVQLSGNPAKSISEKKL